MKIYKVPQRIKIYIKFLPGCKIFTLDLKKSFKLQINMWNWSIQVLIACCWYFRKRLKEYLVIQSTGTYIAFKYYFMNKRLLWIIKLEKNFDNNIMFSAFCCYVIFSSNILIVFRIREHLHNCFLYFRNTWFYLQYWLFL